VGLFFCFVELFYAPQQLSVKLVNFLNNLILGQTKSTKVCSASAFPSETTVIYTPFQLDLGEVRIALFPGNVLQVCLEYVDSSK